MTHRASLSIWAASAVLASASLLAIAPASRAEVEFEPTWQPPAYEKLRDDVLSWSEDAKLAADALEKLQASWPSDPPADATPAALLDRLAKTFAAASPQAAELVERCQAEYAGPTPPDARWLAEPEVPKFVRNNLRLLYARWLAQHNLYDEVLDQVVDLQPTDVTDPAALLFYKAVAYHQLVQPDEARAALAQLMEREDQLPPRYRQVAALLDRDLGTIEDESLDHIARRMTDIRRRLGYGRAGEKVQEIENGVLKSLDKKIDDLEKQAAQQCANPGASGGGRSQKSSQPMQDSQLPSMKAPMQVDRRDIGDKSGWGNLPYKEREQALQQVGREFPAHYRELIEQYFRELAAEPAPPQN